MSRTRVALFLAGLMLLCMPVTTGCISSMSWQTADTVPKGGVEFGMGWSVTKMERIKYSGSQGTFEASDELEGTLPNPFPDLYMRFGLADNLDIGFRLHWLGIHTDVKIRLFNSDIFSLSLAPGLGYSRPFIVFGEYSLDLPLLMTFKLGEHVKIYLAGHGRISGWHLAFGGGVDGANDIHTFGAGANLGFEFGTKTWFIRPEVGYMNYFVGFEDECNEKMEFSWFTFGLGFGFVFGVGEEEQDDKIKRLEERLEELEKEQGSGPATAPPPDKAKSSENPDDVRKRADEAAKDLEKEEEKREGD
jgi:hypothetical protein